MIKLRHNIVTLFMALACFATMPAQTQAKDDTGDRLLQKVRITFNQNNEQEFYDAAEHYGKYLLKQGDISGY